MLSNEVYTHKLMLTDGREIPITNANAKEIFVMKTDKTLSQNRFVQVPGFMGELSKIKEIIKIERMNTAGAGYYCDFGIFHHLHESCNCPKRFYCNPGAFSERLYTMFPNVSYNNQIQKHMRDAVLKSFGLNTFNN